VLHPVRSEMFRRLRRSGLARPRVCRRAAWAAACALACAALPASAQALPSSRATAETSEPFVHESWTVQDGLPVNSVNALLQSRDGYLWIASWDGLVRFDGARFTVFNSSNSPGLPSSRILSLLEARDGSLWLLTEQRQLIRFRNGEFTHFGADRGLVDGAWTMHEAASGTLWVGMDTGLGVIRGERFVPFTSDAIRGRVTAFADGRKGDLWIGTYPAGVVRVERTGASLVVGSRALAPAYQVMSLHEDAEGTLWIGTNLEAWRYRGALERLGGGSEVVHFARSALTRALWILTRTQVVRVDARGALRVLERDTIVFHVPRSLLPDPEGGCSTAQGRRCTGRDGASSRCRLIAWG